MDAAHQKLQDCLGQLAEHFDSVLILVSYNEEGRTRAAQKWAGNYYASKGLAQDWLETEQHEDLAQQVGLQIKD